MLTLILPTFAVVPKVSAAIDLKINFQRPAATVPTGYLRDFGQPYGTRTDAEQGSGLVYGWISATTGAPLDLSTGGTVGPGNGRDRDFSASGLDQRLDTLIHMQADDLGSTFNGTPEEGYWEIVVPNDTYNVTVAAGDAAVNSPPEAHTIRVEGGTAIQGFVPSGNAGSLTRFQISTVQVEVTDGRLTVDAFGGQNTKINYIDIATASGPLQPRVISVNPANGATNVIRNAGVVAGVFVPNGGIQSATVNDNTVYLVRQSDSVRIPASVNTTGGGDSITLQPTNILDPDTTYIFNVTSGVLDAAGEPFEPFSSIFTTGQISGAGDTLPISFEQVRNLVTKPFFSSVTMGPDGKLYASTLEGYIYRYNIANDGTLSNEQQISTVRTSEGGSRAIIGMAFDPVATADNLILWVSHNGPYVAQGADDWTGQISRLSGPNLATIQDYVINLPHSYKDHMVNSIAFRPGENNALYINVGSNSAMGASDNAWGQRPERLLSAAVLRLNIAGVTNPPLNAKTQDGGTYNPFGVNAPLTLYATGVRNAYDLVWHSNGQLYVPTNGSAAGGNTPSTPGTLPASCNNRIDGATNGSYTGPQVTGINGVKQIQKDWLFRVVQGGYYGHPNPLRCEWVMNGGNPTSGQGNDGATEVYEYAGATLPDRNYRGAAYDFGLNKSPNGVIEYTSDIFGPLLKGKLLVVRYSQGKDIVVLDPGGPNQDIVAAYEGIPGMIGLSSPLDLAEDPSTGNLYVVEFSSGVSSRLSLLRPQVASIAQISAVPSPLYFTDTADGTASASQDVTVQNIGTATLTISDISIIGVNAAAFAITNPPSLSVAQGATTNISISFNPTVPGPEKALLRITSNAANNPVLEVPLRGLGVLGTGGSNEPSLQWILDVYDIPVNVGDPDPTNNSLPNSPLLGEEVPLQRLERADNANPVIIEPLAIFGPTANNPVTIFGWYTAGSSGSKNELFRVSNNPSSNGQRINPVLVQGATLTFDPGTNFFGFYSIWPFFGNREVFSEDNLNTFSGAIPHHVRAYPLKDSTGALVPNAYVVATEENTSGFDYQDVVVVVRNVRLAGSGEPELPSAPTNLTATAGTGQVTLNWSAGSGTAPAGYRIFRSTTPTVNTSGAGLATVTGTTYADTAVTNDVTYYYAVVALNSTSQPSPASNTASATPFAASGEIEIFNPDRIPYNDRLVFYELTSSGRKNHNRIDFQVRNVSSTETLRVSPPTITGVDSTAFQIAIGSTGYNIPPGETRIIRINFVDDRTPEEIASGFQGGDLERYAFLSLTSSDADEPQITVELAGFLQDTTGGDNEPTLQQIFNVFGYRSIVRYPNQGDEGNFGSQFNKGQIGAFGDEVFSSNGLWTRANPDLPVYVRNLAALHGDTNGRAWGEGFRFTGTCTAIPDPDNPPPPANQSSCVFWNNGPDWHEFLPPIYIAATSPASNLPSEMIAFPSGNFQVIAAGTSSNRQFTLPDPDDLQGLRFYALRDRQGNIVPNTYLIGQDYVDPDNPATNYDHQDTVYLVTNIRPAVVNDDHTHQDLFPGSEKLVLEFDQTYPGTLVDAQGETIGFRDTQRNEVGNPDFDDADIFRPDQAPTSSYDASKLDINTGGQGTLKITSTDGTNTNNVDSLVNGVCLPFDASVAKFVIEGRLVPPFNTTTSIQQAGIMFGPNTYEFVKLVVDSASNGTLRIQLANEQNNNLTVIGPQVNLPAAGSITSIDLRLVGDPATRTITAAYSVNGGAFQGLATSITLDSPVGGRFFARNGKGCALAFHLSPAPAFTATFDRFAITLAPELTEPRNLIRRINTGGVTVTAGGVTWQSDAGLFTPANSPNEPGNPPPNVEIENTTMDRIYQDYRGQVPGAPADQRILTYTIPLDNNDPQTVSLRLHFAELYWGLSGRQGPNKRLFDVYAEGRRVLNSFDIYGAAGGSRTAVVVPIENIRVEDGTLTLTFHARLDNTSIAAIEVLEPLNSGLTVDAGPDQQVTRGANVQLNGSVTSNNPPFTYSWTQVGGPAVTLAGADTLNPGFTPLIEGTYIFEFRASDALNNEGSATVTITVANRAPVAVAGVDQNVVVSQLVQLNGSGSFDPDNDPLTYSWTQTGGTPVALDNATIAQPTFTAPAQPTILTFELVVTDTYGLASNSSIVTVTVNNEAISGLVANSDSPTVLGQSTNFTATVTTGSNVVYNWDFGDGATATGATVQYTFPTTGTRTVTVTATNSEGTATAELLVTVTNTAPIAHAGASQIAGPGSLITLDGSASSDPDGHMPLTYAWSQTGGPAVVLTGATTAQPTFTAPDTAAILTFELVVTDSRGLVSAASTALVTITDAVPQDVTAISSGPTVLGQATTLTATANIANLTFTWDLGDGNTVTGATVTHTYATEGVYIATVSVANGTGPAVTATTDVVVTNAAPTVSIVGNQEVTAGTQVILEGVANDPDGHLPLTYVWSQIGGPAIGLADANTAILSFMAPDAEVRLTFQLTVFDAYGKSASAMISLQVRREAMTADRYRLYLPLMYTDSSTTVTTPAPEPEPAPAPADLVISNIMVTPADMRPGAPARIAVTVTNQGGSSTGPFWVDLYINPNIPPTVAGAAWETTCTLSPCQGIAWLVEGGLAAGASIVLTSDPTSYYAANTRWNGTFVLGTNAIYAYADSWNLNNPNGIVVESNETNNRSQLILAPPNGALPGSARANAGPALPERRIP